MAVALCFSRRNIVRRCALETGSEQAFGIDEKVAHHCVDRPDSAAFDFAGRPGKLDLEDSLNHRLAHFRYYIVS